MAEEEQTTPVVQDPAPAPTPVAAPPNPGPWDNDLQSLGFDDATRSQVDAYLREKIQPRMTQLEQQAAEARQAQTLMNDLINDPSSTMEALAAELNWSPQQLQQVVEQEIEEPTQQQVVDPRVQQAVEYYESQQAEQAYESEMNRLVSQHPGLRPDLMHPFVVTADGDFDQAYSLYENYVEATRQAFAPPAEEQTAPPTMGDGHTTPPVAPKQMSIHEAVDAMMASANSTDPPPIS